MCKEQSIIAGKCTESGVLVQHCAIRKMRRVCLREADLVGTSLQAANLRGVDLYGAYLEGANLKGADLRGADLTRADLRNANLQAASLEGANLQDANLTCADLEDATYCSHTVWPGKAPRETILVYTCGCAEAAWQYLCD